MPHDETPRARDAARAGAPAGSAEAGREALLGALPDLVVVIEGTGRIAQAAGAGEFVLGRPAASLVGERMLDLVHPDDHASAGEALAGLAAVDHGVRGPLRLRVRRHDGGWQPVEAYAMNRVDDPRLGGIVVGVRPAASHAAERSIRELERRLNDAFDQAAIGMAIVGLDGRLWRVNDALCELVATTTDELVGASIYDVLVPPDDGARGRILATLARGELESYDTERQVRRPDGSTAWVKISTALVRSGDGAPLYLSAQLVDVSAAREASARLRASEERYRALIQNLSDLIIVQDEIGTVRYTSPSIERVLGYGPEALLGRNTTELVHPDDLEHTVTESRRRLADPSLSEPFQLRVAHADGTWRWLEAMVGRIDRPADVEGIVVTARDLTSRHEADAARVAAEARIRALFDHSSDIITILYADGTAWSSPAAERVLGYAQGEIPTGDVLELVHPEDRDPAARALVASRASRGASAPLEIRVRAADGEWRWLECVSEDLTDDPAIGGIVVSSRDVTSQRAERAALRDAEQRFAAAFARSPIGIALVGLDGRITEANDAFARISGHPHDELAGGEARALVHPDDRAHLDGHAQARRRGTPEHVSVRLRRPDGAEVWVLWDASIVTDEEGAPAYTIVLMADITDRKHLEERLAHQAYHDPLTGLANRTNLQSLLERAWERRAGSSLAVLFVDLDRFKGVNDRYGHSAGDELLVLAAERIRRAVRPSDTVARQGGDEFVVVCEDVGGVEEARSIGMRICESLSQEFALTTGIAVIGASVGIALATDQCESVHRLLHDADRAAYAAKDQGRGRVAIAASAAG